MEICTFASGSSGNCTFVSSGGTMILIDAGISMRRINSCLRNFGATLNDISAILITHDHSDHIGALGMIGKYYDIPVIVPERAVGPVLMTYPVLTDQMTPLETGVEIMIGSLSVLSFATPHDASDCVGYRISDGRKTMAIATDMGCVTDVILNGTIGADFAILESNHDVDMLNGGAYPYQLKRRILSHRGHLSNADCARLCVELAKNGTSHFLLAHLSRDNNTPQTAFSSVRAALEAEGFVLGQNIYLDVAPADEMTARYIL